MKNFQVVFDAIKLNFIGVTETETQIADSVVSFA